MVLKEMKGEVLNLGMEYQGDYEIFLVKAAQGGAHKSWGANEATQHFFFCVGCITCKDNSV